MNYRTNLSEEMNFGPILEISIGSGYDVLIGDASMKRNHGEKGRTILVPNGIY